MKDVIAQSPAIGPGDPGHALAWVDREAEISGLRAALSSGPAGVLRRVLARLNGLAARSSPSFALSWRLRREVTRSGLFNPEWYKARHPDALLGGLDPLSHYFAHGFAEGRYPNPLFDTRWYLAENADVRRSGANPLLHYIRTGEGEGRRPNALFDPRWYVATYPDVAGARHGPLKHYLTYGHRERRRPSPDFDSDAYILANADLVGMDQIPLGHYLNHGRHEGRAMAPATNPASNAVTFEPGVHPAQLVYHPAASPAEPGRYSFAARRRGEYTYLPPRRPDDLRAQVERFQAHVLFSIVTPVYAVDPLYLDKLVQSVEAQWYDYWELILVDDASPRKETRDYLVRLRDSALRDPRIKVSLSPSNGGIAVATNMALSLAKGDYVVFLDHDDELTEDCLFELARRIDQTDADFIYSDEDKIDERGAFSTPFFKPDWSPDTFMNTMYTCHVSCVRRELLERVGRVRLGFDGCQDYDLILRVSEKAHRIEHIPRVLYHWRTLPTSLAADPNAKPAVFAAMVRVKKEALARRGATANVEPLQGMPGQFSVRYTPRSAIRVSIIIPSKNNVNLLERCLTSIEEFTTFRNYEIVVIDNGSDDRATLDFLSILASRPNTIVMQDSRPFNFSELNNAAAEFASGELLLFLNDDTEVVDESWLDRMAGLAELSHVGAVGAKLLYPNGLVQHAGVLNLIDGPSHAFLSSDPLGSEYFGRQRLDYNWIAVTGACLMVSKEKFLSVGGFDAKFPIAYNDIDLCFKLWKSGLFNVMSQQSILLHHESASRGEDRQDSVRRRRLEQDWRRLYRKHPDLYMRDPFHNPNLGQHDPSFQSYAA